MPSTSNVCPSDGSYWEAGKAPNGQLGAAENCSGPPGSRLQIMSLWAAMPDYVLPEATSWLMELSPKMSVWQANGTDGDKRWTE